MHEHTDYGNCATSAGFCQKASAGFCQKGTNFLIHIVEWVDFISDGIGPKDRLSECTECITRLSYSHFNIFII